MIHDWYGDGRIEGKYRVVCYQAALADIPSGNTVYGTMRDDLASAFTSGLDRLRSKGIAPGPQTVLPAPMKTLAAGAPAPMSTDSNRALSYVAMGFLVALLALWLAARRRRSAS